MRKLIIVLFIAILAGCESPTGMDTATTVNTSMPELDMKVVPEDSTLPTVVFIGDSRVALFPDDIFADDYAVINLGLGGSRAIYSAQVAMALPGQYDAIVISTGINDTKEDFNLNDTLANIEIAAAYARLHSRRVYITTVPGCWYGGKITNEMVQVRSYQAWQINSLLGEIEVRRDVTIIPLAEHISYGFFLHPKYSRDGIHYNAAGYAVLHDLYVSMIEVTE